MAGIKETSDVVRAIGAVVTAYKQAAADGLNLGDLAVLTDQGFLDRMQEAFDGIEQVPGELQDLSWQEILRLVRTVADQLS